MNGAGRTREAPPTMERIGLLGGMSWEPPYDRPLNEARATGSGGLHSADCLLRSVDFHQIETTPAQGRLERAGGQLAAEAAALEAAGADFLVLCTNTMHKVAAAITGAIAIPPSTSPTPRHRPSTAGSDRRPARHRYTMEHAFYVGRLLDPRPPRCWCRRSGPHRSPPHHLPGALPRPHRATLRTEYRRIIHRPGRPRRPGRPFRLHRDHLLVGPEDAPVPVFETTRLHANRAVDLALGF